MRYSHATGRLTAATLLITGLVATAPPALAAPPATLQGAEGSAYGLAVAGPLDVAPVPSVASSGPTLSRSLLRENHTDLVNASALDVSASSARARSTVARAAVPPAHLLASVVSATCEAGRGSAHLTRATIAGRGLDSSPPPNTTIPVDVDGVGRTSLTLNKQERRSDGRLTVTAIELRLPLPGEASIVKIASATCGATPPKKPEAPAPTPVEHNLPVTG